MRYSAVAALCVAQALLPVPSYKVSEWLGLPDRVEQAFRPAEKLQKDPALAAEVTA